MSSDIEHWHINAKVYDDRVEEIHLISDPARNIRRKQYTTVWHIERYLGRGSCGEVRLERNRNEDKVRAVKRVTTSSSTLSQKECEQELKALLEFSKPKSKDAAIFVEFFGWFNSGFDIYLVMEYIELGDLEKNVQLYSGKLPEVEAQSIAEQILSGLEIMHTASFAHRDLKPQNVLVVIGPPQWWVKLADFGLSKRLTDSTAYHTSAGTLPYMAPEILNYLEFDASGKYTNAVDLWALGCIVYRLITSNIPFPQGTSLIRYCRGELLFPDDPLIKCGVTDSGSNFLRQLLAINPKERLSAAEALQHHWITSGKGANATSIPPSASHTSLRRAEVSGSSYSAIEYNTVSHAGLKSYGSLISSEISTHSSPMTIPLTATPSTSSEMADASYLIPRKLFQQNLPSHSKKIVEKSLKPSSNKMEAQYEPETTIRVSLNNDAESAVADAMPVELASNSHESLFTGATTDLAELIGSENFQRGRDLFINQKYSGSEQVFQQISQGREKVFGKEAVETLESKYLLARTLYAQKQDQKAEELLREVVRGQEKVLGKEAIETLESKYWLAATLYVQNQFQKAEELFREVVRGQEKVLGIETIETLKSKHWLARTLYAHNQDQKAIELFREVVRGEEKVLGREALKTLESKYWLAKTLYMENQFQEAEELFGEVVRGQDKVLGIEAIETLKSKHWLARTLYMENQCQKAEKLFREVVRREEKLFGKEALKTLESQYWLARTLYAHKQFQKAKELFREVVRGQEKVLGKEAIETLESKYWLAATLYAQKQDQKAEELFREVVRGQQEVLGKEATETLESKHCLARTLYVQKQYQKAEELCREVVRGREKILGTEHPKTVESRQLLNEIGA